MRVRLTNVLAVGLACAVAVLTHRAVAADGDGPTGRLLGVVSADLPDGLPINLALALRFSDLVRGRPARLVMLKGPGPFLIDDVPAGAYHVAAFIDRNGSGAWEPDTDAYAVRRAPVTIEPGADCGPLEFDRFFNAEPRGVPRPEAQARIQQQAQYLYQGALRFAFDASLSERMRRRAVSIQQRLRNVMYWTTQPLTPVEWTFQQAELRAAAEALEHLQRGEDPVAAERGPVRRAVRSEQRNAPWPYALYIPEHYDPHRTWPLFVVLHGAGGNADRMLRTACAAGPWGAPVMQGREPFPPFPERDAFVLCPFGVTTATPFDGHAANVAEVLAAIDAVQADYRIDVDRTYLTGVSMGGGGAWRIGLTHPDRFGAIAPIAGTLPWPLDDAGLAPDLPVLAIHGALDDVIPIAHVREYVAQRRALGGRVELRELADGDHFLDLFGMDDIFAALEATRGARARAADTEGT